MQLFSQGGIEIGTPSIIYKDGPKADFLPCGRPKSAENII